MVINATAVVVFLGAFLLLVLIGMPIAYALGITAFVSAGVMWGITGIPVETLSQRIVSGTNSFTTLAIPLFILAGKLMNEGKISDRLFGFCDKLVGRFRGGLGYVNVLGSVIFAGMSGSAAADAAGLGSIEIAAMKSAGYDDEFSCAVTGASALISPIIPPSVIMVTYGVLAGTSVSRLFLGGVVPGLLMGLAQCVLVYFYAKRRNYPRSGKAAPKEVWESFKHSFFALLTPVIILLGIWTGAFTPTEASAVTVVYALILSICYRSITLKSLWKMMRSTIVDCAAILFIMASISAYSYVLTLTNIPSFLAGLVMALTTNPVFILLLIIFFLLVMGCFMSAIECIMLFTPIFLPILKAAGIDLVFFGVIMCVVLMIGQLTPPFGTTLFILSKTSGVSITRMFKASIPFIISVLAVIALCMVYPNFILALPNMALS